MNLIRVSEAVLECKTEKDTYKKALYEFNKRAKGIGISIEFESSDDSSDSFLRTPAGLLWPDGDIDREQCLPEGKMNEFVVENVEIKFETEKTSLEEAFGELLLELDKHDIILRANFAAVYCTLHMENEAWNAKRESKLYFDVNHYEVVSYIWEVYEKYVKKPYPKDI